jgi:hypothetical protein
MSAGTEQKECPMSEKPRSEDVVGARTGEYTPAGEGQGKYRTFTAQQVADAFDIDVSRVHNAFKGEFDLGPDGKVNSKQAQELAEIFLGDLPLDGQQAALMKLGAFTPRPDDTEATATPKAPGEQSDKLRRSQDSVRSTS